MNYLIWSTWKMEWYGRYGGTVPDSVDAKVFTEERARQTMFNDRSWKPVAVPVDQVATFEASVQASVQASP